MTGQATQFLYSNCGASVFLFNLCCVASPVQLWTAAAMGLFYQLKAGL